MKARFQASLSSPIAPLRTPQHSVSNVCSSFFVILPGKYVPNVLIECDQKPEHYLRIQCRSGVGALWERERGKHKRKLSITVFSPQPQLD